MRRRIGHCALLAIAWGALLSPAQAHGPAPAVLEVLARDAEGPTWLRASVGLLRRRPDGSWEHVCPDLWDGNDRMLAAVADDRPLVVSTLEGFRMPATDRCEPWVPVPEVWLATADGVTGQLHWLQGTMANALTLMGESGPLESVPSEIGSVSSIVARGGRIAVAGRTGVAIWAEGGWTTTVLPERLRWVRAIEGESLYGAAAVDGRYAPERIDPLGGTATLGPPGGDLLGPVRFGETMRALADGQWLEERGDTWEPLGPAEQTWTCLRTLDHGDARTVYACSLEGLFELSPGPLPVEAMARFRFVQIDQSDCALCEADWAHYGGDVGWLDTEPATSPDGERRVPGGGCSASGAGSAPAAGLLLVLAFVGARRRRQGSSGATSKDTGSDTVVSSPTASA